jgi:hypothetical protein
VTASIAQSFSMMGFGRGTTERLEKNLTFVIYALGAENSFVCVALKRLRVEMKLSADFGRRMPAGFAFILGEAADSVRQTDPSHTQTGKALTCSRA